GQRPPGDNKQGKTEDDQYDIYWEPLLSANLSENMQNEFSKQLVTAQPFCAQIIRWNLVLNGEVVSFYDTAEISLEHCPPSGEAVDYEKVKLVLNAEKTSGGHYKLYHQDYNNVI